MVEFIGTFPSTVESTPGPFLSGHTAGRDRVTCSSSPFQPGHRQPASQPPGCSHSRPGPPVVLPPHPPLPRALHGCALPAVRHSHFFHPGPRAALPFAPWPSPDPTGRVCPLCEPSVAQEASSPEGSTTFAFPTQHSGWHTVGA